MSASRDRLTNIMKEAIDNGATLAEQEAFAAWISGRDEATASEVASAKVLEAITGNNARYAQEILSLKQYLVKKSV